MATIKQTLQFAIQGDRKATNALKSLTREQKRVVEEFRLGNRSFDEAEKELRRMATSAEEAENSLRGLRNEQERLNQVEVGDARFSQTSREVALAGDVQSNLGALSGLAGAAGAGGVAQGIGVAGEITVLAEELPRLKEAARGLPQVLSSAASSLGTTSLALGGFGAALAGLFVVLEIGRRQAQKSREDAEHQLGLLQQEREIRAEAQQMTSDELEVRRDELALQQEIAAARLAEAQAIEDGLNSQDHWKRNIGELSATLGVGSQVFAVADENLQAAQQGFEEINQELVIIEDELMGAAVAANDAAAAEQMLTDARLSAADAELNAQRSLNSQLATLTTEQINTRLEALRIELAAQQQLLSGLEGLQRVEQENIVTGLEAEIDALSKAMGSGVVAANDAEKAAEEEAKAAEQAAKELDKMKTATDGVTESTRRAGLSMGAWSEATVQAFEDRMDAAERAEDEIINIHERRLELVTDFNQREAEIIKQNLFDRNQAHERFLFDEQRLLEQGMFSSAFDARREQSFSNRQTGERLQFEQTQRSDSLTREIAALAAEFRELQLIIDINTTPMFDAQVSSTSRTITARTVDRTSSRGAFRRQ